MEYRKGDLNSIVMKKVLVLAVASMIVAACYGQEKTMRSENQEMTRISEISLSKKESVSLWRITFLKEARIGIYLRTAYDWDHDLNEADANNIYVGSTKEEAMMMLAKIKDICNNSEKGTVCIMNENLVMIVTGKNKFELVKNGNSERIALDMKKVEELVK